MLVHGQVRYEQVVLGTQSQRVAYGLHVGLDVVALDQRGAGRGADQSGQHGHGGRLAGPVVSEQNGYLVRVHIHGQFVHDVLAWRETLAERLDLYAGFLDHVPRVDFLLEPERRLSACTDVHERKRKPRCREYGNDGKTENEQQRPNTSCLSP